jgi:hypothetical protein
VVEVVVDATGGTRVQTNRGVLAVVVVVVGAAGDASPGKILSGLSQGLDPNTNHQKRGQSSSFEYRGSQHRLESLSHNHQESKDLGTTRTTVRFSINFFVVSLTWTLRTGTRMVLAALHAGCRLRLWLELLL